MKCKITLLLCLLSVGILNAQTAPQWLRYSAISPDGQQIAFTYKGDLYRVPVDGGQAMQLTYHEAHDYMPVWSKDSKQLAFASERYGNFDVYIMDAMGGPAKRLSYHSTNEMPFSFTPDNQHVVFGAARLDIAEHRQYPTALSPNCIKLLPKVEE